MAAILVVDDHASFRAIVRDVLISAGHTVCEASDGRAASRLVGRRRYDLVITDMMMPDMDGIEVIIELRRMSTQTKILAVSSGWRYGPSDVLSWAREAGADDVITKPLSTQSFIDKVSALIAA